MEKHTLFKYREFNKTSIELLINRRLWFAKPESLNDPFECQNSYQDILNMVWEKYPASELDKMNVSQELDKILSESGICSFSRTRRNQLMWSHYADEHKGICIGFNENIVKLTGKIHSIEVDYQLELPYQNIIKRFKYFEKHPDQNKDHPYYYAAENNLHNIIGDILYSIICTKSSDWKYEEETRLVRYLQGSLEFSPKAISSISLGLRMSERDKVTLKSLLNSSEWNHVKWYQAEKSKNKYALEFTEIKI